MTQKEIQEAADLLARFIAIPSITLEPGQPPPDGRYGETGMAAALVDILQQHGLSPAVEEVEPGRPQVTVRIGSGRPELLLTSHLDTVAPANWEEDPFRAERAGDRMRGLGACDDKGSLTAMLLAFTRLAAGAHSFPGTVALIGMVGEERFGVGSRHLMRTGYRPAAAIVGEPTEMRVVRVECGNVRWRVHTRGRAAHGSRPWEGDNAIYRMADVLRVLRDEVAPRVRAIPLPPGLERVEGLGSAALNAGVIQGGTGLNVVPDRCTLWIERRVLPGEDPLAAMEAVNRVLREQIGPDGLEFEPPIAHAYPFETPGSEPVVRSFQDTLAAFDGLNPEPTGVSYGSDANRLSPCGIPCVLFGPGSISQAHTAGEWVDLRQVALAARVLEAAALRYFTTETRRHGVEHGEGKRVSRE